MQALFGGNPLATPVGQRIDNATDVTLAAENWGMNMEITDIINETEEGPKDAMRALRKKMSVHIGKNYQVINLCLTVIETCVKNCGKRFHMQVANKDFLQELVKIIAPKNEAPISIQERILGFIQTWADAFKGSPELKEVERCYQDLRSKGIDFPMTDLDNMAPIHTPARTHGAADPPEPTAQRSPTSGSDVRFSSRSSRHQPAPAHMALPHMPAHRMVAPHLAGGSAAPRQPVGTPGRPTAEQLAKLQSELDIVHGNVRVLNEMVSEVDPNEGSQGDIQLMGELHLTCRRMQERVVALIGHMGEHEGLTEDLLRVNDDLNNVFLRYGRFEKNMTTPPTASTGNVSDSSPMTMPVSAPPPNHQPDLISLEAGSAMGGGAASGGPPTAVALSQHMSGLGLEGGSVSNTLSQLPPAMAAGPGDRDSSTQEFDMFAESRQAHYQQGGQGMDEGGAGGASQLYANQEQAREMVGGLGSAVHGRNKPYGNELARDNDAQEMAAWLEKEEGKAPGSQGTATATSSEFDQFLAERALAAESLPNKDQVGGDGPPIPNRAQKQMQKDDTEGSLFAL